MITPAQAVRKRMESPRTSHSCLQVSKRASLERLRVSGKAFLLGDKRTRINGVTFGPFPVNSVGAPFPEQKRFEADLALMRSAGINAIRTYHLPPESLLSCAVEAGIGVLVDAPWSKHLCFLDSETAQREARESIRHLATHGGRTRSILAYSIGNEIPPDVIRWHGAKRVERFLSQLADVARQTDPDGLVTYANFPPTEYLELPFLDFATFNVYLHDREIFRRYLVRLQNLVGDKPLILGELGLDTLHHGEIRQAEFLSGHLREVALTGLAGGFIFSWTDDWHTGGFAIEDWAFGITHRDRLPKASFHAVREVFRSSPCELLAKAPRVSVVVCTYNGGRTLDECLRSLEALDYPDFEVIVVNDGSTDNTSSILSQYPFCRVIHQENLGLSASRNVGLYAATGSIVAYTDSDCFVDPQWLTHLVHQLECTDAAAVGGPNLSPDDGWVAACVAASPGQPMHVLESDHIAEHIPGCNMAFRREALLSIDAFDVQYRIAGDDVDICWRLQQAGHWITFAPGAFVWHHRRHTPTAYLRQQAGYGQAEALLRFAHPDHFNSRGDGRWRGFLYGASLRGLQLKQASIFRGRFGTGLFQCLYTSGPSHWAMLPSSLEWIMAAIGITLAGLYWPHLAWVGPTMLLLSIVVAGMQARQASLPAKYGGMSSRLLLSWLCFAQPLVRSWNRYRTRYFVHRLPRPGTVPHMSGSPYPWTGAGTVKYWSENGCGRLELLSAVLGYLNENRWGKATDTGWRDWDLEIDCSRGAVVQVCTAQEEYGQGKRRILARFRLRPTGSTKLLICGACCTVAFAAITASWPAALIGSLLAFSGAAAWIRGARGARIVYQMFDLAATRLGLSRCNAPGADEEVTLPVEEQADSSDVVLPLPNAVLVESEIA